MTLDDSRLKKLRSNAELVVTELQKLHESGTFGYDEASVAWIDTYIERAKARWLAEIGPDAIVALVGSYLGEAIIRASDGHWDENDVQGLGIRFPAGDWCFPFSKVAKQLVGETEGAGAITSFYRFAVQYVAPGQYFVDGDGI